MRGHVQVVVVGGGAVGASCLYHLAEAGIGDCLLIEKNELSSGSTWHAAGNIPTYATSWLGMRAGNYAWQLYSGLGARADSPITYRHTGAFWPAHTRERMDLFRHLTGVSKTAGFELAMITPDDMESMHPFYSTRGTVLGGIYDPYEGDIDPSQLTQALVKVARTRGAEVARFTRVTGIERSREGEWRVRTDKGDVLCETVVNAAGFYGSQVSGYAGQHIPVAVLEHQYLVTEGIPALEAHADSFPLIRDPEICFYLRRERASLLFGSYGHPGRPAFTEGVPEHFAHQLFPDSVDDMVGLIEKAVAHVPLLGDAGVQRFINGPIAYSPDALPLCGPAFNMPNFYHACGIQIGITHSAAAGKAIAEWVTRGETEWDLAAWDPRRFGEWATTEFAYARATELYGLQYAIPYPHRILGSARPLQSTPLYPSLQAKGAVFGEIGGWERAFFFDRDGTHDQGALSFHDCETWRRHVQGECQTVRDKVGVMDHGGFTKFEVAGPGASSFLDYVFCGSIPNIGRVKLSYLLTPEGMIWSESTIACLDRNNYLLCGPTLANRRDFDWLNHHLPEDGSVTLRVGSERDAALMVMGPRSRVLLSELTTADLSKNAAPWMSVREIEVAGKPVTAMRVSYVGELGFELHLSSADLNTVYNAICEEGEGLGLTDFGSYALNCMRIEKGYHAWGSDFGTEYTVFDAGIDKFVNFTKPDFIGRPAVLRQRKSEAAWAFAGFVVEDGNADPLPGDPIFLDGDLVGYVTSGGTGYRIGRRLALGYVKASVPTSKQRFEIEILGDRRQALLSQTPFYDPMNERMRG